MSPFSFYIKVEMEKKNEYGWKTRFLTINQYFLLFFIPPPLLQTLNIQLHLLHDALIAQFQNRLKGMLERIGCEIYS